MKALTRRRTFGLTLVGCFGVLSLQASTSYYHYYYHAKYASFSDDYCGYDDDGEEARDSRYAADVNAYNNGALKEWNAKDKAYSDYQTKKTDYDKRYSEYLRNKANWENATGVSGVGATLDLNSYVDGHKDKRIVSKLTEPVEVPSFSDISTYRSYCQNYVCPDKTKGGRLDCDNMYRDATGDHQISFTHSATNFNFYLASSEAIFFDEGWEFSREEIGRVNVTRTVAAQHIAGGYAADAFPYTAKQGNELDDCEANCVVLIGTYYHPIILNGPVYVDGDVIIRGFVKGQGSIYAGRNIHIIGDISYFDPPSWPHGTEELKKAENQPEEVKARNKTKDLLLLAARGNIIVGDYTSQEWTNATQMAYLNLSGKTLKTHATSESDIGYTSGYPKDKNYTAEDGGSTICGLKVTKGPNKHGTIPGGGIVSRYYYVKTVDYTLRKRNRRYYESSIGEVAIQNLKQTSVPLNAKPTWQSSSTLWKRILGWLGFYETDPVITDNTDSGDVTEIDAILYANHGIFGVAGGSTLKKLHLNGAMICKDEGLLTSFAGRFANDRSARAWINWDMRIKSDLDDGVHIGAPEKETDESQGIAVKRVKWNFSR